MTIKREDIDNRRIDFSDVRSGRRLPPSPEFWINLQARHALDVAERTVRKRIEREAAPRAA